MPHENSPALRLFRHDQGLVMSVNPSAKMSKWDVAIVGSGVGGLTAGALLAHDGARVVVCEQHNRPGGFCHTWRQAGAPR